MTTTTYTDTTTIPAAPNTPEGWHAWLDKMPPPPDALHVRGSVTVPNPGVDVALYKRVPQGVNPTILLLNLVLVQRPGIWPQVITAKPVAYDEVGRSLNYNTVEIGSEGQSGFSIPVEIVQ